MSILDDAIKMEKDGERYYAEQAKKHENDGIKEVCLILSMDEALHAQILENRQNKLPYELAETESYTKVKSIFQNAYDVKSEIRDQPTQLDFYETALDMEKKSVDMYTALLAETADDREKELFRYLVGQEKLHYALMEEVIAMLRHAEEWVESAEFGIRTEEY